MRLSDRFYDELRRHEGYCEKFYRDHLGFYTIGYGFLARSMSDPACWHLDLKGKESRVRAMDSAPREEILDLLVHRIKREDAERVLKMTAESYARILLRDCPWMEEMGQERWEVCASMSFNLGPWWTRSWPKTISLLKAGDYEGASVEMLDSRWARQVGQRAVDYSRVIATGLRSS